MYPKPHDTSPTTAAEYQALADDVALEAKHVEGMKEQLNQKLLVAKAGTVRVGPPGMPLSELVPEEPPSDPRQGFVDAAAPRPRAGDPAELAETLMAATEKTLAGTDCRECGHPVDHHDAGECWTNPDDTESVQNTCGCHWYEPIQITNPEEKTTND